MSNVSGSILSSFQHYGLEPRYMSFFLWSLLWITLLRAGKGSTACTSLYRLNFWHGILSTITAILCLNGLISEAAATPCTLSYFMMDFFNMLLNDFVFKVEGYQKGTQRKTEYCHHIFCFTVGIFAEFLLNDFCPTKFQPLHPFIELSTANDSARPANPFVALMLAEFSTPVLMLWRVKTDTSYLLPAPHPPTPVHLTYSEVFIPFLTKQSVVSATAVEKVDKNPRSDIGVIFLLSFICCRFWYHAYMTIPIMAEHCSVNSVGIVFQYLYNIMNTMFLYFIANKILSGMKSSKKKPA